MKLLQGNCLEELKNIADKSVDLVVIDPPYQIVAGGSGGCFGADKRTYHSEVKTLSE